MKTHGNLSIATTVEPSFQENAFLLWTGNSPDAWVIDPGLPPQADQLAQLIRERELTLRAILLTHCHGDHLAGVSGMLDEFPDAQLWSPRDESHMLGDPNANLSAGFGIGVTAPDAHRLLDAGDQLTLGEIGWKVLDVGGHSPGGLAYYAAEAGVVIVGDALFAGSIGRYDFPGSDGRRLLDNIRRNLLTLPSSTIVYAGHGPATTIGTERQTNPCLQEGFFA